MSSSIAQLYDAVLEALHRTPWTVSIAIMVNTIIGLMGLVRTFLYSQM
jgi:hypothetical protein